MSHVLYCCLIALAPLEGNSFMATFIRLRTVFKSDLLTDLALR